MDVKSIHQKSYGPKGCRPKSKTQRHRTFDMIVVRNYKGKYAESKCCHDCINILKKVGIRRVYYSTKNGNIVCEKVINMSNKHSSGRE